MAEFFGEPVGEAPSRALLQAVVRAAATVYGVPETQVTGENRTSWPTRARRAAMIVMRQKLNMSFPAIGKYFHRDHTSVMDAIKRGNQDEVLLSKLDLVWTSSVVHKAICPTCGQEVDRNELIRDLRAELSRLSERLEILARGTK